MDFYELKAFIVLSQKLHFAKASSELNMSPSALSRMISRLEDECGAVLFDRNNREVALTKEGRKFVLFAEKCLNEHNNIINEFSSRSDLVSGTLHVYASVTACYTIMPPFIKRLSQKYPLIQLSVETGDPAGSLSAIREGRAELAVAAIPENVNEMFDCIPVRTSPLVFAASSDGPFVEVKGSPQDIVSSVPLILPRQGIARNRFNSWIKSRNVKPNIVAEAEGNEAVMALSALGLGIGLVPQIVLENGPYKEGFICHSAGNALGYYEIGFVQKKALSGSESLKKIRSVVTDILHSNKW